MPPPPAAITTAPASVRVRTCAASRIAVGAGLGTTRRNTPGAVSTTDQPSSATRRRAESAVSRPPIGLVGCPNAGSSASTSTWVSTATARSGRSCAMSASSMARHSRCPMPPCESATASHSGSSGSPSTVASGATSSPRRRMKPTCGPLPCVTSTRHPASTSSTTCRANAADRSCCRHNEPDSPSCTSAFPPIAIRTTPGSIMSPPPEPRPGRAPPRGTPRAGR